MKILHTSDWHLGKRLAVFSRTAEQIDMLEEIIQIADDEMVDAVLVAGDSFDNPNPDAESVELFYRSLKRLANNGHRAVVVIAGNHDSPERIESPDALAKECGIFFAGFPDSRISPTKLPTGLEIQFSDSGFIEIALPQSPHPLRLILCPYANEYRLKAYFGAEDRNQKLSNLIEGAWKNLAERYCDERGVNILLGHLLMTDSRHSALEEDEGEKKILSIGGVEALCCDVIPKQIQYTALGHIHRHTVIRSGRSPVVYCGSPLYYSFGDKASEKSVEIIEASPSKAVQRRSRKLVGGYPLISREFHNVDSACEWLRENPEAWVELTLFLNEFLSSADKMRLAEAHQKVVQIIPILTSVMENPNQPDWELDENKDIDTLFREFYRFREKNEPPEELVSLFLELYHMEEE